MNTRKLSAFAGKYKYVLIILLAADFFIPMRQLGSFFHIAMNGMAASDKIFRLLDLSEPAHGGVSCPAGDIVCRGLRFSYEPEREILHGVDLTIPQGKFVSLVGESGCGKSTISALLMGRNKGYTGSMTVGGAELRDIEEASLMRRITYVSHQSYLFKGSEHVLVEVAARAVELVECQRCDDDAGGDVVQARAALAPFDCLRRDALLVAALRHLIGKERVTDVLGLQKVEGQQLLRRRGGELFALLRRQGGHAPAGLVRDRHAHAARCDDPADLF